MLQVTHTPGWQAEARRLEALFIFVCRRFSKVTGNWDYTSWPTWTSIICSIAGKDSGIDSPGNGLDAADYPHEGYRITVAGDSPMV